MLNRGRNSGAPLDRPNGATSTLAGVRNVKRPHMTLIVDAALGCRKRSRMQVSVAGEDDSTTIEIPSHTSALAVSTASTVP